MQEFLLIMDSIHIPIKLLIFTMIYGLDLCTGRTGHIHMDLPFSLSLSFHHSLDGGSFP